MQKLLSFVQKWRYLIIINVFAVVWLYAMIMIITLK